jgi:uncharacterized tellurite resistance protein B-like protein
MPVEVLVILAGLVATVMIAVGVMYLRYANSPAGQWKRGMLALVADQEARLRAARRELVSKDTVDSTKLRDEYLGRHLRSLPVEELARYPGIGPVTVARLRDAGLTTVADCARVRLSGIQGIGPSRQTDLKEALSKVRRDAASRFDAGACQEATAFAEEVKRREAERERRRRTAEQAISAAEAGLKTLEERARIARRITFVGHLRGRQPPEFAPELMNLPLNAPPNTKRADPTATGANPTDPVPIPPPGVAATPAPESGRSYVGGSAPESASGLPTSVPAPAPSPPGADLAPPTSVPDGSPLARLRAAAGLGFAVAKADGRIAASERKQIRAFLQRRYAQTPDLADRLDSVAAEVENDLPTLGDALWDVRRLIPRESWPDLYQFAVSVADAAGERNAREVECLARVAEELKVARIVVPAPAPVDPTPEPGEALSQAECRAALEIAADVPLGVDLIRRQYRLLSDRFSPDRFGAHGPEFVRIATDKLARVERAARQLLAAYNEPLEPPTAEAPADLRHNPDLDAVFGA